MRCECFTRLGDAQVTTDFLDERYPATSALELVNHATDCWLRHVEFGCCFAHVCVFCYCDKYPQLV
jgi:hypothetical protein